jgi:hypothetical protein
MNSAFDISAFAVQFQEFLDAMTELAERPDRDVFEAELGEHLRASPRSLDPVRQEFPLWRWVDVDAALDALSATQVLRGVVPAGDPEGLSELLSNRYGNYGVGSVDRKALPSGPGEVKHVATNALRLLEIDGEPVVAFATEAAGPDPEGSIAVEVLSADPALSRSVLSRIDAHVREQSVLRGQVVSFRGGPYGSDQGDITFHSRPRIPREDVILPEGSLERIESSVLGMSENSAALRDAGQHLSRGILLFGPPGSGKTHTVRYLLSRATDTTAIVLNGDSLGTIRQASDAARELGRAIIVLEDADLVAADRDFSEGERSILFDVLDVLDGLADDADIAFVLTTNRVGVLEEALALRPGRIDLAVEVPLPTRELRRRLFTRYGRDLPLTGEGIEQAASAAEGTTGSFAKEAVRRAVMNALALHEVMTDDHLLAAVDALVSEAAELRDAMALDAEDHEFGEDL